MADERNQDAGLARSAGAGRQQNALRVQRLYLLHRQLIVAIHLDLGPQLSQVLDQVVSERVVVVENKDHGEVQCTAPPAVG